MLFYSDFSEYIEEEKKRLESLHSANLPEFGVVKKTLMPTSDLTYEESPGKYSITSEVDGLKIDSQGIFGERHRAATRASGGRETKLYPKGTMIRGHRHLFAICSSDMNAISEKMGFEITAELLGVNLVIDREDGENFSLTELPVGSYLLIDESDKPEVSKPPGAALSCFVKQEGCGITGHVLATKFDNKKLTKRFREATKDHRGILCSVEYPVSEPFVLKRGQRVFFRYSKGLAP